MCKQLKFFEKCPENFQIPLQKITNPETMKNGHVYVGFSPDGKYLLSYQCKFNFHLMDSQTELCYTYTLHWWLFDLLQPIKKVRQVQLFANENIHYELHILICQPPDANYIVVHGATYSVDMHSNGKMTYVSVIPMDKTKHSMHLRYELLPPHPPFVTSISLKLPNVILLNSGDILFAVLLDNYISDCSNQDDQINSDRSDEFCFCQSNKAISENNNRKIEELRRSQSDSSFDEDVEEKLPLNEDPRWTISDDNMLTENIFPTAKVSKSQRSNQKASLSSSNVVSNIDTLQQLSEDEHFENMEMRNEIPSVPNECSNNNLFVISNDLKNEEEVDPGLHKDYISFILQGFSLPCETATPDSLPASPFDCTTQVLPCHLSSFDGIDVLRQAYEHRCFRSFQKGKKVDCNYFIGQAQFDAENFVNVQIQQSKDISLRFVSMRDYDMQVIDLCEEKKEVILLINALVVFRDSVQRDEKLFVGSQSSQRSKLSLYTLGYIASWNVYSGLVTVLKRYPIVEGPGTICKTRQFSPSLSQAVQLRKGFFVPTAKPASVQTLSNHTVFSGKSLQYLFNPLLPVAVVM